MSQIITIPAREVVPGMLYDGRVIAKVVGSFGALRPVRPGDREMALVYATPKELNDLCWQHADHVAAHVVPVDGQVAVTLPGPSPCEMLCSCPLGEFKPIARWQIPGMPLDWHLAECPVRRLRLRVWPAPVDGMPWTWDTELGCWNAGMSVFPHTLLRAEHSALLSAAFCLPEVQP